MSKQKHPTVYVVTAGEYSDYRIEALFSSKAKAEAFVAEYAKDPDGDYTRDACIETWVMDEMSGSVRKRVWRCSISMESGDVATPRELSGQMWPRGRRGVTHKTGTLPNGAHTACVESCVSPEHAIKLAVEARQKWLRTNSIDEGTAWDAPDPTPGV